MTTSPPQPSRPAWLRGLLLGTGVLVTALGTLGAFLPILPTTPFLLLAAACFARSSPRFHRRLLANRVFGPYLAQWQRDRSVPRAAKRKAYGLVLAAFTLSIALVGGIAPRIVLAILGVSLLAFLRWLPTTAPRPSSAAAPPEEPPGSAGAG